MATAEIRYQVGEAWKGTYNASTEYSLAAVVKDPQGMSVYRSLRSGNVGHPVTDTNWWFCIIDMSSIKNLNDNIIQNENNRASAEYIRERNETTRQTNENSRVREEEGRVYAEKERVTAEEERIYSENRRVSSEQTRSLSESGRVNAENNRVLAETTRNNHETTRVSAETTRQTNENNRVSAEEERVRQATADHLLSEEMNTHPMRINTTTGTWERWDADNDQYVDTGVMAMASPFATFDVDVATGCIIMTFDATYTGPQFSLDQNTGNLLLTI